MSHRPSVRDRWQAAGALPAPLRLLGLLLLVIPATFGVLQWAYATPLFVPPAITPTVSPIQGRVDLAPAPGAAMDRRYPKHFPVDLYNGEVRWAEVDLRVPSRGFDFVFRRVYTSRSQFDHALGHSWDFAFNKRLTDVTPGGGGVPRELAVSNGAGREDVYTETAVGSGTFHAVGLFDVIVDAGSGAYTQTFPNGFVCQYADSGLGDARLASCADRAGNTSTITRNGFGNPVTVVDTQDRAYQFTYTDATASQRIATLTDFSGRTVVYGYTAAGDLKTVRSPVVTGTPTGNDFPNGKTRLYAYSSGFADARLNHNLIRIIEPLYNVNDTPGLSTWAYQIQYQSETDPNAINFDRVHKVRIGHVNGGPLSDPTVDVGGFYTLTYKVVGSGAPPAAVQKTICRDPNSNFKDHYFDANRDLVKFGERMNRGVRPGEPSVYVDLYRYSAEHLLTRRVLPRGNEIEFLYDAVNPQRCSQGNLLEVRRQAAGVGGGGDDLVTRFTFDPVFNQVRTVTDPRGFPAGVVPLDGGGHLDLADPTVARYTTTHVYDYQEGTGFQAARGVPAAEQIPEGLGDQNGDADFNAGNRVRTLHPTIQTAGPNAGQQSVETYTWNPQAQLLDHVDPEGTVRRSVYFATNGTPGDPSDLEGYRQQHIVDATGLALTTTWDYDVRGNVIGVIDPKGQRADFTVNALNQVVRRLSRETAPGSGIRYTRDFVFNANDDLVEERVANLDETGAAHPHATIVHQTEFNVLHRVVARSQDRTRDDGSLPGTTRTEVRYDANLNPISIRSPESVNGNQPDNRVTRLFDERDLVFRAVAGDADDDPFNAPPASAVVRVANYDPNGNLVETIDHVRDAVHPSAPVTAFPGSAAGDVYAASWDGFDRRVAVQDPEGNVHATLWDAASNVVQRTLTGPVDEQPGATVKLLAQTDFVIDELDRVVQALALHVDTLTGLAPPANLDGVSTTTVTYDRDHKPVVVTDDRGLTTTTVWDSADRAFRRIDHLGNVVEVGFDANSNVTTHTRTDVSSDLGGPPDVYATTLVYDGLDRRTKLVDPAGQVWERFFDARSNVARTSDAERGTGHPSGPGNTIAYAFDALSRLIRTTRYLTPNGTGDTLDVATNPTIVTTQDWDDNSRVVTRTDDNGHATTYGFDAVNRLASIQYADQTQRSATFDQDSKVVGWLDANGTSCAQTFDGLGRLVARAVTPGAGVIGSLTETFGYDGASRLTKAENDQAPAGGPYTVRLQWDTLSNLTQDLQQTRPVDSLYDGVSNRTHLTYSGIIGGGGRKQLQFTLDNLNRVSAIQDAGGTIATWHFKGPRRVERRTFGDDLNPRMQLDIQWDAYPRPVSWVHTTGAAAIGGPGQLRAGYEYAWTRTNRRNREKRLHDNGAGANAGDVYAYDSAYRLIDAKRDVDQTAFTPGQFVDPASVGSLHREEFAFDGVQNYTSTTKTAGGIPSVTTYFQDPTPDAMGGPADAQVNQYTSRTPAGGPTENFVHDLNGNRVGDANRTYHFDFKNRLVEVRMIGTGTVIERYCYDALDRRIAKCVSGTEFVFDGPKVIEECGPAGGGGVTVQIVNGGGGGGGTGGGAGQSVLQIESSAGVANALNNSVGSIVATIDEDGQVQEQITYSPTGLPAVIQLGPASANQYGFQGLRLDPETGFNTNDNGAYYDPGTGRGLTRNPGQGWGDGAGLGAGYSSGMGDPVNTAVAATMAYGFAVGLADQPLIDGDALAPPRAAGRGVTPWVSAPETWEQPMLDADTPAPPPRYVDVIVEHVRQGGTLTTPFHGDNDGSGVILAAGEVGLGCVPLVGELQDCEVLFGSGYHWSERVLAGGSLVVSVFTAGFAPNFGSGRRAVGHIGEAMSAGMEGAGSGVRAVTHAVDEVAEATTSIVKGSSKAPFRSTPNSIYEQVDASGRLRSRTWYDENGNRFSRQDFDHPHGGAKPHEHHFEYNEQGQPIAKKKVTPLDPKGYDQPTPSQGG